MNAESFFADPNPLAEHYSRFRVTERILLTGHSHQAWPDITRDAQLQAWDDAARLGDKKWELAFAKADRVRRGFTRLLDDEDGYIALGQNTHELIVRFLSALPLRRKPRLVTTDSEFHSLRRQLQRLREENVEVVVVPQLPIHTLTERLVARVNKKTAALLVSSVFFNTGLILQDIPAINRSCQQNGCELLIDAYHQLNVIPFSIRQLGLQNAYITGGGYKYCQLGEGNCFLRFPHACQLRPILTGWFAEFGQLETAGQETSSTRYPTDAQRFAGSTYDPVSHYRAAAVFDFFETKNLAPSLLRQINQRQIRIFTDALTSADFPPEMADWNRQLRTDSRGGFLALRTPAADTICTELAARKIYCDVRRDVLRIGPAPYLSNSQLREAATELVDALRRIGDSQGSLQT